MLAAGVKIATVFTPEHGITGREDRPDIADARDQATGLPIRSLYNNGRYRLTPEMLRGVDTLVFDIQDVGARFYTYSCTMLYALEEAAKAKLPFYVLDRPNPVTGLHVEGPMLDANLQSFVGLLRSAGSSRAHAGRTRDHGECRAQVECRPARHQDAELGARRLVRFDRSAVGRSIAQYAQPERGDALSRPGADRVVEELFGGAGNGCSV